MIRSTQNISFKEMGDAVAAVAVASLLLGVAFPLTIVSDRLGLEIGSLEELAQFFSAEVFNQTSPYITVSLGFVAIGATLYISAVNRSNLSTQRDIRDNELLILFARIFNLVSAWMFAFTSLGAVLLLKVIEDYDGPRFTLLFTGILCWMVSCCFAGLCSPGEIANAKSFYRLQDQYRKARQLRAELDVVRGWSDKKVAKNYTIEISALSSALHALLLLLCCALMAFGNEFVNFGVILMYGLIVAPMCYFLYFYTVCSLFVYFHRGVMYIISVFFVAVVILVMYLMTQTGLTSIIMDESNLLPKEFKQFAFISAFFVWILITVAPVAIIYVVKRLRQLIRVSRIFYSNAEVSNAKRAINRLRANEAIVRGRRHRWSAGPHMLSS